MTRQKQSLDGGMKAKETVSGKATGTDLPASKREGARAVSAEERYRMIADAAYFLAEQRDFDGDAALDDWLQAEMEVNERLSLDG